MQKIKIPLKRALPIRNKTQKKDNLPGFDQELIGKVFGQYDKKFNAYFLSKPPAPISSWLLFLAMEPVYKIHWQMKEKNTQIKKTAISVNFVKNIMWTYNILKKYHIGNFWYRKTRSAGSIAQKLY